MIKGSVPDGCDPLTIISSTLNLLHLNGRPDLKPLTSFYRAKELKNL